MENQELFEVTVQFKVVLKELLKKLHLLPAEYESYQFGLNRQLTFQTRALLEDKNAKQEKYRLKGNTKKKAKNESFCV